MAGYDETPNHTLEDEYKYCCAPTDDNDLCMQPAIMIDQLLRIPVCAKHDPLANKLTGWHKNRLEIISTCR